MTVKELAATLTKLSETYGDNIVILSGDGEGNSFSPIPSADFYSTGLYRPENTWSGEFIGDDDADDGDEDEEGGVPALILWPTN